ncbi:MAG TPA: META domain-containing protein [Actinomycetota bacterium]|nr:META domain-containing protein [Actinomycetota bacterium]
MRPRRAVVGLVAMLAILLVACGGDDDGGSDEQDPANLEGKSWVLTQMLDAQGDTQIVDIGVNAEFDGSSISGVSGCNRYNGSYEATGDQISFGPIGGTQMACEPDVMAIEARYLELLGGVASYRVEGRSMSMNDAEGTPVLQFSQG